MPTTAASGDIEILPQGAAFGSTATMVYIGSIAFNTVSTNAKINLATNQISVQVRGGGAHVAIDVVGYFKRPGNYGDSNTTSGEFATMGGGYQQYRERRVSATVGGGLDNTASDVGATVGGGQDNTASGFLATVPGGGSEHCSRRCERCNG